MSSVDVDPTSAPAGVAIIFIMYFDTKCDILAFDVPESRLS